MSFKQLVSLFLVALSFNSVFSGNWVYKEDEHDLFGPSQWGKVHANCDGKRQSPINIVTKDVKILKKLSKVKFEGNDKSFVTTTYKNDGHGFAAQAAFKDGSQPNVTGGPLGTEKYTFWNFHVHWPSEHSLDGKLYAAELHIVHYNLKYGSINEAILQPDGLAVVGIFMDLNSSKKKPRPAFAATSSIRDYNTTIVKTTRTFPLEDFHKTCSNLSVWSYLGSLTTPTCNEAVTWLVSKNTIPIYQSELNLLKLMKSDHNELIEFNNRPCQNLNGRNVTRYF